jgi:hypothetical protein
MKDNIPKIIHFIWIDFKNEMNQNPILPEKYKYAIDNCKRINNNFNVKIWNGYDCLEIVKTHFPKKLEAYQKLKYPIQKCDWIRLMICYIYGGIYMDCDRICQYSLDNLPKEYDVILPKTQKLFILNNDFIMAKKKSDFLKYCIDGLSIWKTGIKLLDVNLGGGMLYITYKYFKYNGDEKINANRELLSPCGLSNCSTNIDKALTYSTYDLTWLDNKNKKILIFFIKHLHIILLIFFICLTIYYYKLSKKN